MRSPLDLPFYNDKPVAIGGWGWFLVLAATAMGFFALALPISGLKLFPYTYVPAVLFAGLPLIALAIVSRRQVGALFSRYSLKGLGASLGFAVLTMLASALAALALSQFYTFNANPSGTLLTSTDTTGLIIFLSQTFIQLMGEELVTILPLLAVLWFCTQKLK